MLYFVCLELVFWVQNEWRMEIIEMSSMWWG